MANWQLLHCTRVRHARAENRWLRTSDSAAKVFLLIRLEHAVIKFYRLLLATLPPSSPAQRRRPFAAPRGGERGQVWVRSDCERGREDGDCCPAKPHCHAATDTPLKSGLFHPRIEGRGKQNRRSFVLPMGERGTNTSPRRPELVNGQQNDAQDQLASS